MRFAVLGDQRHVRADMGISAETTAEERFEILQTNDPPIAYANGLEMPTGDGFADGAKP